MSLVINHNLIAINAGKSLDRAYRNLAKSTQRLSSGLRINSAGDDPAGMAIREIMRTDIAVMAQGRRNTADGISLIQTAEGALAIIDEKLIRMKELAEQAATGTYTTFQREILNSEYQAMATEIDRIANATEFNGIKLLDGSITDFHSGSGLKIHFGKSNDGAEDYYLVRLGDVRATSDTGLRVGGDALRDIHDQIPGSGRGVARLDSYITESVASAGAFVYYYNYLGEENISSANLQTPSYLAGIYQQSSGATLQDLINDINRGSASRIQMNFQTDEISALSLQAGGQLNIALGNEVYQLGWGPANSALVNGAPPTLFIDISAMPATSRISSALANAVGGSLTSDFDALQTSGHVFFYHRQGGDNDHLAASDFGTVSAATNNVTWTNMETWVQNDAAASFGLGGEDWARSSYFMDDNLYYMRLAGGDVSDYFDLVVADAGATTMRNTLTDFGADDFVETQDASAGAWAGAQIRTQSHAQEALAALDSAINRKDKIRADLGAYQNRLENTSTNLQIQGENLQGSESRISDVDMALEMTEYTRHNILAQAATAMLSQANTLPQLALTLLG